MMRALYSGVAGLKTHQTRMDVIGNNIANVNTVGFKGSAVNFSDTYYQMVSSSTGANADFGTAGQNAKQIGLGSMVASITVNITEQGGPSTTNRALDVAINGESFLVVRSGTDTCFTKSGALNVDAAGNLYCTTNGATVQGWMADSDGNIIKDMARDLTVMSADTQNYPPVASKSVTLAGNIDPNDTDLEPTKDGDKVVGGGEIVTFSFYDKIGDEYTVQVRIVRDDPTPATKGYDTYKAYVENILDSNGDSIFVENVDGVYRSKGGVTFTWGTSGDNTFTSIAAEVDTATGKVTKQGVPSVDSATGVISLEGADNIPVVEFTFNSNNGVFDSIEGDRKNVLYQGIATNFCIQTLGNGQDKEDSTFEQYDPDSDTGGVNVYFNSLTAFSQGGNSKLSYTKGYNSGGGITGTGNKAGKLKGISIDSEGKVWGNYDNGMKRCLAQMAVATFANPSGLESVGNSLFMASLNSGDFDGVGEEVTNSGSFTVGALEMSNVDLANEFVTMITTQRGFQANSRIITTTDSMLEELVNLKR